VYSLSLAWFRCSLEKHNTKYSSSIPIYFCFAIKTFCITVSHTSAELWRWSWFIVVALQDRVAKIHRVSFKLDRHLSAEQYNVLGPRQPFTLISIHISAQTQLLIPIKIFVSFTALNTISTIPSTVPVETYQSPGELNTTCVCQRQPSWMRPFVCNKCNSLCDWRLRLDTRLAAHYIDFNIILRTSPVVQHLTLLKTPNLKHPSLGNFCL
jgi:hypothetical protein